MTPSHERAARDKQDAIARADTHIPTVAAAGNRTRTSRARTIAYAAPGETTDTGAPTGSSAAEGDPAPESEVSHRRRYAPLAAAFGVLAALLVHASTRRDRELAPGPVAVVEGALATFFLARTIAREKIGAVVREPFVEPAPGADPADAHGELWQPTGTGLRHATGELLTCTRCLGPWAAAAVTAANLYAPRQGRTITRVLALGGANTLLQAGFALVTKLESRR